MASDARLSLLPCRLPAPLPPPPAALRRSPRAAAAAASTSPRCRVVWTAAAPARGRWWRRRASSEGQVQQQQQQQGEEGEEVVDSNVLPYCSIDRKQKKTIGDMEQEFLQAMQALELFAAPGIQAFYYDKKAVMSNEEFDNLKEELMWEGSSVS
nr:unnamed protein product [Digitaria exilis]